jgi:DNA-binding transcriptional regulator YdaS (Cro superfamily)
MKTSEAIAHYSGNKSALARALGIDQSSVYDWGEFPPPARQLQLERITDGGLKAEPGCKERLLGVDDAKAV